MFKYTLAWRRGDWKEALKIWQNRWTDIEEYVYFDFARLHIKCRTATWLREAISNLYIRPLLPAPSKEEVRKLN